MTNAVTIKPKAFYFIPYCASLTKQAMLESSVTDSILIGFENGGEERRSSVSYSAEPSVCQLASTILPKVRYFRTKTRIFKVTFVSPPLVKGNEGSVHGDGKAGEESSSHACTAQQQIQCQCNISYLHCTSRLTLVLTVLSSFSAEHQYSPD